MTFLFEDINSIDNILTHSGLLQFLSASLNELMFLVYFRLKAYQPYIYILVILDQLGKCLVFGDYNRSTVTAPDFCGNDENLSKLILDDISDSIEMDSPRNSSDSALSTKMGDAS